MRRSELARRLSTVQQRGTADARKRPLARAPQKAAEGLRAKVELLAQRADLEGKLPREALSRPRPFPIKTGSW